MDQDYLDPFRHLKTLRWVEPYHGGVNIDDTGFCNRILHWGIAYRINKLNNFKFKILLQGEYWAELEYLNLPHTKTVKKQYHNSNELSELKFKTVFDLKNEKVYLATPLLKDGMLRMIENNNFNLKKDNYYSNFGYNFINEFNDKGENGIPLINFKHKDFEKEIQKIINGHIGIHIRRGKGVNITLNNIKTLPKEFQHLFTPDSGNPVYKWISDIHYFKIIDNILQHNPKQNFYISTDMKLDQYQYILDRYPNKIKTKKDIFSKVLYTSNYDNIMNDFQLAGFINTIDLFTLANCEYIIKSPGSTWSEVASILRDKPSININENPNFIINKLIKFFDQMSFPTII